MFCALTSFFLPLSLEVFVQLTTKPVAELERWLSSCKQFLVVQRTRISFPAPTRPLTTVCNCSSRVSNALLWPPRALGMHVVCIHTCKQIHKNKSLRTQRQRLSRDRHGTPSGTFKSHLVGEGWKWLSSA